VYYFVMVFLAGISFLSNISCRCQTNGCYCSLLSRPCSSWQVQEIFLEETLVDPKIVYMEDDEDEEDAAEEAIEMMDTLQEQSQGEREENDQGDQEKKMDKVKEQQKEEEEGSAPKQLNEPMTEEEPPIIVSKTVKSKKAKKQPLIPMQVLDEYISQHSADALRQQPDGRQYMLATFACPRQAGVETANFMNAFLLAVASNRTMLFRYGGISLWRKNGENDISVCQQAFDFADWMPRFDDVFPNGTKALDLPGRAREVQQVGNATLLKYTKSWSLSMIPGEWRGLLNLTHDDASYHYTTAMGLKSPLQADSRVQNLYAEGPLFLYGMLFGRCFSFTQSILDSVQPDLPSWAHDSNVLSIALHSRHLNDDLVGANVTREVKCVQQILTSQQQKQQQQQRCLLYIMSDRAATVTNLARDARDLYNCTVVLVSRTQEESTAEHVGPSEHGPFAGLGYFQDVALSMHADTALVGQARSSTSFLAVMMEYRRKLVAWEGGDDDDDEMIKPLARCSL